MSSSGGTLSPELRRDLLDLARRSIEGYFRREPLPRLTSDRADTFGEARALFVTLRKGGELRGCIGTLAPDGDLGRTVPRFARRAALDDPRFGPLTPEELAHCEIEISVLTPPQPVASVEAPDPQLVDAPGVATAKASVLPPSVPSGKQILPPNCASSVATKKTVSK